MKQLLLTLLPFGTGGWQWTILRKGVLFDYRADLGDERINGKPHLSPDTDWIETNGINWMVGLSFDNAKKEIRRAFNPIEPIDMCMFSIRTKVTLRRLVYAYQNLLDGPELSIWWGITSESRMARNHWFIKHAGEQRTTDLGYSIPEACDYVREMIRGVISLNAALTPQRVVNEETKALVKQR